MKWNRLFEFGLVRGLIERTWPYVHGSLLYRGD